MLKSLYVLQLNQSSSLNENQPIVVHDQGREEEKKEEESSTDNDKKVLNDLEAQVTKQGMVVKQLKKDGKPIEQELKTLQELKKRRDEVLQGIKSKEPKFDLDGLQNLITRRMIVVNAFEIHGGVAGLLDLGPVGVGMKDNICDVWKKHFIYKENMLQVECTNITPHSVLNASGHVQRFNDLLVEELNEKGDPVGEYHRADKLLESHIEKMLEKGISDEKYANELRKLANGADSLTMEEMDKKILELQIVGPISGRKLSPSRAFNLMFATTIGPGGNAKAYLRPETAQGIFVNFKRLLEYNGGKMPFASAQIGTGFRNEIAPKGGLIRVREFTMAEIEHFVHPLKKQHARFSEVENIVLQLFTSKAQTTTFEMEFMTTKKAVEIGAINNETLAYFMARSQEFFIKIGIDPKRLRFRQHLPTEMAHYASDCYDAEILLSSGWLECAGHADRACYDLTAHSKATNIDLVANELLEKPIVEKITKMIPDKKMIGGTFKNNANHVILALENLQSVDDCLSLEGLLEKNGQVEVKGMDGNLYTITRQMAKISTMEKKIFEDRYSPSVIEPSFGIGRVLYALLEHSFWIRKEQDEEEKDQKRDLTIMVRNVLSFKPIIAPLKCGIIPYGVSNDVNLARKLEQECHNLDLNVSIDNSSNSIGRKYSRFDEIGTPFVITLDDETKNDQCVTLRERDTEEQVRLPIQEVVLLIKQTCTSMDANYWVNIVKRNKTYKVVREGVKRV